MILYLDQGNTFLKWQLESAGVLVKQGRDNEGAMPSLQAYINEVGLPTLSEAWLACVATDTARGAIRETVLSLWGVELREFEVQKALGGLVVVYDEYQYLGVDRWLLMLAAYAEFNEECIVVSAGTALTIDVIDGDGRHKGGFIAPGVNLLMSSLGDNTARLQSPELDQGLGSSVTLGKSTDECIRGGALHMSSAYIECATRQYVSPASRKILCGGDAAMLGPLLTVDFLLREAYVFDGMRIARSYLV